MLRRYPLLFLAPLLLMLCLLALFIYNAPGTGDFRVWQEWIRLLDKQGFHATLVQINDNYPPFSLLVLDTVMHLSHWTGLPVFFWLKMSLFFGLFGTVALFYAWTRNGGLAVGLYLALLVNVGCGYLDVYWTVTLIAALWALDKGRYALCAGLYTLSVMTKPQPILAAPFLALYILDIRSWRAARGGRAIPRLAWRRRAGPALIAGLCVLGLFGMVLGWAAFAPLINAMDTFGQRGYVNMSPSGNAMNVNWILTHLLLYSSLGALTCFMLNTGMHENHLYVVPLLTVGLAALDNRYWAFNAVWLIAAAMNLVVFYGFGGAGYGFSRVVGIDLPVVFSVAFMILYFLSLGWMFVPEADGPTVTELPDAADA